MHGPTQARQQYHTQEHLDRVSPHAYPTHAHTLWHAGPTHHQACRRAFSPWPELDDASSFASSPSLDNANDSFLEAPLCPAHPTCIQQSAFLAEYEPVKGCLGSGLSGGVHECRRRMDGQLFAFKLLPCDEDSLRELAIWAACMPHPNVVDIIAMFDNTFAPDHPLLAGRPAGRYLVVVMPKMHIDLFDHMQLREDQAMPFNEQELRTVAQQLIAVLSHMHALGFVHGDIKLENVLLESPTSLHIRLCDFGFARQESHTPTKRQFTRFYVSPEAIFSYEHRDRHHMFLHFGASSDIWALGVALYVLFFSVPPFDALPDEPGATDCKVITPHMRTNICKGTFSVDARRWLSLSPEAQHFFMSVLTPAVDSRPNAAQLISSPWLSSAPTSSQQVYAPSGRLPITYTSRAPPPVPQQRARPFKAA